MPKKDKIELLQLARSRFQTAHSEEQDVRDMAGEDIRFENGEQWDKDTLKDRQGRPCPVVNKVSGTTKQIIGDALQNRPRIKIRPVDNVADPKMAELMTGLVRNIENVSDADTAYDTGIKHAVRGGFGYWRVLTEYADDLAFEQDIRIKRIVNPFSVYFDPAATEIDFSDARYCFVCETLTEDEFKAKYPNADPVDWEHGSGETPDLWFTGSGERKVRVAEYWYKEPSTKYVFELADGRVIEVKNPQTRNLPSSMVIDPATNQPIQQPEQNWVYGDGMTEPLQYRRDKKVKCERVMWCKINGQEIIDGPKEWAGKYIPVVPCLGEEIWIDGKRDLRSAIRFAKEPARIYNWTRANSIEIMALGPKQPWLVTDKMIEGHEAQWNQAFKRPMPYLKYNPDGTAPTGAPARQSLDVNTSGIHQEALLAADDIKATTGLFDASLGARGNETSGRAIIARQREGDTATFEFPDNQVKAIRYTGRILVDLIPKIYDTERVVRLMGDDGAETWAKVNITDPATGKIIANDLSIGRYDVVVDAGPGYMTKRMEAADGLIQFAQVAPQFAPIILPRVARNLDWPEATELADEIKQMSQPQGPDPRMQLEMEKGKLDLQGKQLDNQGKVIDLQGRAQQAQQAGAEGDQRTAAIAQSVVMDMFKRLGLIR